MRGLLAKRLRLHVVGAFTVSLGFAPYISLLWLNEERRHMQISTEIMIPWKILRSWGRLVSFRVQSDLEYKEFLWVEFHGSLSLSCVLELWNWLSGVRYSLSINKQSTNTVKKKRIFKNNSLIEIHFTIKFTLLFLFFLINSYLFVCSPHSIWILWDLGSPARSWTCVFCSGSTEL